MMSAMAILLASHVSLVMSSCETDAYEKGEGDLSLMTAELVEAHIDAEKHVDHVETDQGERLTMTKPLTAKWITTADTTYRAMLYYKKTGSGQAEAVSFGRVGVLLPHADSIKGGMKTDPVNLESAWLSQNRRYLNLRLRLLTGHTDDDEAVQSLGLVGFSALSTPKHVRMTLYHDQGGQPEYYSSTAFVSIPLSAVSADTLSLSANTYHGMVERTFRLR